MAWTEEQQQAIDLEGHNIIVSAGAGSGKTAVLTARVIRKLLSGKIHINELLVLTFTNAAAQEMKDRIRKAIRNNPSLKHEEDLLEGAYITTFDAFSLAMVKKYHTRMNITKNIKITDEVMVELQKRKILDEIMDKRYENPTPSFQKLITDFCLKDDTTLKNNLLVAYKKIELKYDKTSYLKNYQLTDEIINSYIEEYVSYLKELQSILIEKIEEANHYFDGDFIGKIEDSIEKIINARTYEDFLKGSDYQSPRVPSGSSEEAKSIKKEIFDLAGEIKDLCSYESIDEIKEELETTKENIETILSILIELDEKLDEYKKKEEIFTFQDISRLAISIVETFPDIREELTNSFQEILVDEYQDTSDTQEMFISLISKNNVYMVGDIKQSIYRFRNANPYIFKNKYDTYRDTDAGIKIDLLKNFRSREEVLSNINLIFDHIMDDTIGGADYQASHRMVFGNNSYLEEGKTDQNYQMEILHYDKSALEKTTPSEAEAFIIGKDIEEKINNHYQVFDKDKKVLRDCEYQDFVILLDKGTSFDLYKKIFEYLQIPLTILKDESLSKEDDILVIKNLLELILHMKEKNYDTMFQYAYTSVSRSFLYQTNDQEIYNTFSKNSFLETSLFQKCIPWLERIDTLPISRFLIELLNDFQYDEKLITIGNVDYYQSRLEYMIRLAKQQEEEGKTIEDFVAYLTDIFDNEFDLKIGLSNSSQNSCRMMTIHGSKGLEFPICYFAGFTSKFNMRELNEKILYDNHYGFILPKVNECYKDTILKTLLKNLVKKEDISERVRLFYVALTRAKEKMIIVLPNIEEEQEVRNIVPLYKREKYDSFYSIMNSITSVLYPYMKEVVPEATKAYLTKISTLEKEMNKTESLVVEEINLKKEVVEKKHYSKENLHLITKEEKEVLEFGTKIHEVLEEIDFKEDDIASYPIPNEIKEKITSFLTSDFMKEKLSMKIMKEYEFIEETEEEIKHGYIDLLLEDDNQVIIVDYKLKNLDDSSYDKQLLGYKNYIERKTNKKVSCYLYSILENTYREVKSKG